MNTTTPATTIIDTTGSATVRRLLDDDLAFDPVLLKHYSDHMAMMLTGLDQMGAPPEILEARVDEHIRSGRRDPHPDMVTLDRRRREVAELGIVETVRRRLPDLVDAPATALFHPAIRLAYALDLGHEGQVAAALLDWETRHETWPVPDPAPGNRTLDDVAADLARRSGGAWEPTFDLTDVAGRPELAAAVDGLDLDAVSMDDVARFALAVHVVADEFTSLHMVTGARALHRIGAIVDDGVAKRLARHAATTMAMLHGAVGAPRLLSAEESDRVRSAPLPSRREIAGAAIRETDPHDVKLANVALVEEERTGDPLYRFIAGRVLGLS